MQGTVSSITRSGRYEPFELQVARGHVAGHSPVHIRGYGGVISTTAFGVLWEGATSAGGDYAYPGTASQLTLVSTSASDTSALSVQINGLDASFKPLSETIALNGLTAVTTLNSFLRINNMAVTNGNNVGTVTASIGATHYAQINPGVGTTQMGIFTMPAGFNFYQMQANVSTDLTSGSPYMRHQRYQRDNLGANAGRLWRMAQGVFANDYTTDERDTPVKFNPGTDIQWQLLASSGTANLASILVTGVLVSADVLDNNPVTYP